MSFFDENKQVKCQLDLLPENIKTKVKTNATEIKSVSELNELVRRIRTAETGKLY